MDDYINKRWSTNNELFVILLSIISLFYFTLGYNFIPDRFHFDSETIRQGMLNLMLVSGSYRSTSKFFKDIGLNYSTPLIVLILLSWMVFIFLLVTILKINKSEDFSRYQISLLLFFLFMYGFYFTNYSKDIIILIFLALAIDLPAINKNVLINIIITTFIYGYFFRDYWIAIGIISLIPLLIKNVKINRDLLYIFIAVILFIVYYHMAKHGSITHLRINVNANRIGSPDARSMIHNFVASNSVLDDIINYLYVLISLLLPIQGFPTINIIVYYLWIWGIIYYCIKYKKNINWRIMFVIIIYMNIQALFEPDFGSAFRHQLAWFPVLYYVLNFNNVKDK